MRLQLCGHNQPTLGKFHLLTDGCHILLRLARRAASVRKAPLFWARSRSDVWSRVHCLSSSGFSQTNTTGALVETEQ